MKKKLVTYFQQIDPSPSKNISAGYNVGQEWYNTITGDKFYHRTDGVWTKYETSTSAPAITQVTYTELVALIGSSSLVPDRTYLLTDYMTTWNDPSTGVPFSSGVVEPLYITATDTDKLSKECKSELYPQDIVYYEVTGDIGNGEGTEGFTKGKIYRRIDTIANNDIGTDWRHITSRRYAMKVENPWTMGNSYNPGDIVNDGSNIYICIDSIVDSQSVPSTNWFLYPSVNGEYAGIYESGNQHSIYGNLITVSVDPTDYQDHYLFEFSGGAYIPESIYNNNIDTYYLNNNVILSYTFYENKLSNNFKNNHIKSSQFSSNEFNLNFASNLISSPTFYYNEGINAVFSNNICIEAFRVNKFNNDIYGNIFAANFDSNEMSRMMHNYVKAFYDNVMANSFSNNILKTSWFNNACTLGYISNCKSSGDSVVVSNNLFTGSFDTNIIKLDFKYNRLSGFVYDNTFNGNFIGNEHAGEEFLSNTFLGGAERNIMGTSFIANTIGDYFNSNIIGSGFYGNVVGESFQQNNIKADNGNWIFRNGINRFTILNAIDGTGRNIPYIPGTYDKTIRLSNGVLKCDYVDEYSDIIFQPDNTGPTFTFKSNLELFVLFAQNKYFPISMYSAITPFIVDWRDVINPLIEDIAANSFFAAPHTYIGKLSTDQVEVVVIGEYIDYIQLDGNEITEFELNLNTSNYLQSISIGSNLLTSFDPSIALPDSLENLYLYRNQLTSFDPSIALPDSLKNLLLYENQLTSFNPVNHALPSSLANLDLNNNQLTSFNPVNHLLPSSLQYLYLSNNQLDTTEVNNTLILLNSTYTIVGSKSFTLNMSPPAAPDGAGLAAKTQLQAKGYAVTTD